MLHPAKSHLSRERATAAGANAIATPRQAARAARRELARIARPAGDLDARRYFRGPGDLAFYNTGTSAMRALARSIHRVHCQRWSIDEAVAFADALITDRHLEAKSVGIEIVARYRRDFTPRLLEVWKRWLADNIPPTGRRPTPSVARSSARWSFGIRSSVSACGHGGATATCGCAGHRSSA